MSCLRTLISGSAPDSPSGAITCVLGIEALSASRGLGTTGWPTIESALMLAMALQTSCLSLPLGRDHNRA
jgi:hypothetical protein